MAQINTEIKAKSNNQDAIRKILKSKNANFKGIDHQIDTYFKVNNGRLKLREGKIENHLIYYQRENKEGPEQSDVTLFRSDSKSSLKEILTNALGILVVVNKKREIYFIDNVKFHIDIVENLGRFVEIEATNNDGLIGEKKLFKQCQFFLDLFKIPQKDLISISYSDLLLQE